MSVGLEEDRLKLAFRGFAGDAERSGRGVDPDARSNGGGQSFERNLL